MGKISTLTGTFSAAYKVRIKSTSSGKLESTSTATPSPACLDEEDTTPTQADQAPTPNVYLLAVSSKNFT